MAGYGRGPPEGPPDRITYLPIDRSRAAEKVYAPWDPRARPPAGGMRLGEVATFVAQEAMPALDSEGAARACDQVVAGRGVYPALLSLGRARLEDFPALLTATASDEVRQRWERLWVLSPFFSRLSRQEGAAAVMVPALVADLGAVHLLSKFGEQNQPAVKRLFARLHDPLLTALLETLFAERQDPRRANLVSNIIASIESMEAPLLKLMPAALGEAERQALADMLYVRPPGRTHRTLKASVIRDRLMGMRR